MVTRGRRLNQTTCPVVMRDADGNTVLEEVYREDQIRFVLPDRVQLGLVIDFGEEEEQAFGAWRPTGRLVVEIQHITVDDDGTITGEARPYRRTVYRSLHPVTHEILFTQPWVDAQLLPVSPRRPPDTDKPEPFMLPMAPDEVTADG
jgi:hypothetical protein